MELKNIKSKRIEVHFNSESQQNHLEDIYTAIKLTVRSASHAPLNWEDSKASGCGQVHRDNK